MRTAVVGLGRVGLPLAAVSSRFHDTIGIDIDATLVRRINERVRFTEPMLNDYLRQYGLMASSDFAKIGDRELIFICVGSQSLGSGYSAHNVLSALTKVAPYLHSKEQVLTVTSTVPPRTFEKEIMPFLKKEGIISHVCGVCYNPAMIALGNVIKDFEQPNYVLIGESNKEAGRRIEEYWRAIVGNRPPMFRSTIADIAFAKYTLNTALVLKITLMNIVTELCEKFGAEVDLISEILKADPRLAGPKMFKGGLGFGGTCFPVDIEAFRAECRSLGLTKLQEIATAIIEVNDWQVSRSIQLIESLGLRKVAVLGVTFKPNTSTVVSSQSLNIADGLAKKGYEVTVYDPEGLDEAKNILGEDVHYAKKIKDALALGDAVLIGVEWPEFAALEASDFRPSHVVVDPWRILRSKRLNCRYIGFGIARG